MSERYTRLFSLPENLYAEGSPVIIAAGALLKDNQTGQVLAQLKLRSISEKDIQAVKVCLYLFDTAGCPIGEPVMFDYLDLRALRDAEFGQKTPVMVPESKARSYTAAVTEVVFSDKSTWTADGAEWEALPRQRTLEGVFQDTELVKQYKITVGSNFTYYPMQEKGLWFCACGAVNRVGKPCHVCGRTLPELRAIDREQLVRDKDARLAEEARQAAEEKAAADAQRKKTAKILKIVIPAVSTVIAFVILLNSVIIPNGKYNKAISLMEAGQYKDAIAAFEAMDGYKDSTDKIKACETAILDGKYNDAVALMDAGQYEEAIAAFEALDRYKDSAEKVAECAMLEEKPAYEAAVALEESGEKARAAIAFAKLTAYPDAKKRSLALWDEVAVRDTICGAYRFTLGLKANGTIIATGNKNIKEYWQLDEAQHWTGITAIAAGDHDYIALFENGTVGCKGYIFERSDNEKGFNPYLLEKWSDIVAISANDYIYMLLKSDGTVIAGVSGHDSVVSDWSDIVAISAGSQHIVGLKSDGTVVAKYVGKEPEKYEQCCDVSTWTNIIAISAGRNFTLALKADGTVLFAGNTKAVDVKSDLLQCCEWDDIISISAGSGWAMGLRSDGTVVVVGYDSICTDVSEWTDIVAICAHNRAIGLRADGTVVAAEGYDSDGACNVGGWRDIKLPH